MQILTPFKSFPFSKCHLHRLFPCVKFAADYFSRFSGGSQERTGYSKQTAPKERQREKGRIERNPGGQGLNAAGISQEIGQFSRWKNSLSVCISASISADGRDKIFDEKIYMMEERGASESKRKLLLVCKRCLPSCGAAYDASSMATQKTKTLRDISVQLNYRFPYVLH